MNKKTIFHANCDLVYFMFGTLDMKLNSKFCTNRNHAFKAADPSANEILCVNKIKAPYNFMDELYLVYVFVGENLSCNHT